MHQVRRLHGAVANERLLAELEEAAARVLSSDPPLGAVLHSSILEVGERHCVVVAANTVARQALLGWLGALGVEVLTSGELDRSEMYVDQAYVVGPPRFFRPSLITAPVTNSVSFLVPAWFGDRSLPRSAIAPYADGAIRIEARAFTAGDLQEVDATIITAEHEEELLPGPIWGERKSPQREPTFDEVEARKVLLSGNLAVWLDDGERIRTLDPAQPSGERVTYTPVIAVQQGTFLVLRQGESERGALHHAAMKLLGSQAAEVEGSQNAWKQHLSRRLSERGYQAVTRELRSRGVKAADRVRAWTEQCLVRPNKDSDFELLLRWLDLPIQPTFGRAKVLRTALYRASAEIREQLEAAISAQDMSVVERDGHMKFDGQIEGFRGIIATRVLAIAPHKEIVSRREARLTVHRSERPMARMMPAFFPEDAPPGEKALYSALASSSETKHWIVLHSLAIADHVRQVEGEADFVIVVPDHGVLVLEVKSHRTINRLGDGRWKLGASTPVARGPFQQASEAMHSLREFLRKRGVDLRSIPTMSAVWFTHVRARTMLPPNPEWHEWQVLDSEDLRTNVCAAILRTLAEGTAHLDDKMKYFSYGGVGPDEDAAERIASILRPRFEMYAMPGDSRRARQTQLISFIDEQFQALDAMAENRAVVFTGPAGTGKTLLAMEAAQREAAMGRSGRLLCFNRFLGRRLIDDLGLVAGLRTGTFHQELLRIAGVQPPSEAGSEFWEVELPDLAVEALLENSDLATDYLVIDEIQDIAREQYLDVLDLMVIGGLEGGRLLLFGDFERQTIFDSGDGRALLRDRVTHLASHRLTENCRNLPRIGYQVNLLSRLNPGYQQISAPRRWCRPPICTLSCRRGPIADARWCAAPTQVRGLRIE